MHRKLIRAAVAVKMFLVITLLLTMGATQSAFAKWVEQDVLAGACQRAGGIMIEVEKGQEYYCYLPDGRLVVCVVADCWIMHPEVAEATNPSPSRTESYLQKHFGRLEVTTAGMLRKSHPRVQVPKKPNFTDRQRRAYFMAIGSTRP